MRKVYSSIDCYKIAKLCTSSSEMQRVNASAYNAARRKGWLKEYKWFKRKQHTPYTYNECYAIAKEYNSRLKFARGNVGAYQAALTHNWLNDYIWFNSKQKPYNYWTKARVLEESKKYKTRGEFSEKCRTAYSKARVNGWLDEFIWLKDERIDLSKDPVDCVYSYEFLSSKAVYVGRTLMRRVHLRDKEHLFTENDAVCLYAKNNNIIVPKIKILDSNLTIAEGVEREAFHLQQYIENGWVILNRTKPGSVGKIATNKWTSETCYLEAQNYKSRGEFAKLSASAYEVARCSGWLDDYIWFDEKQKPRGYWADYDNCFKAASQCRTKTEFIKRYNAAYTSARKNNWISKFTWFNIKRKAHNKKWFYATICEESKKYQTRTEFCRKSPGAYKAALKEGLIDTLFPLCDLGDRD